MSHPAQPVPRIFVSYSRKDTEFTQRLVSDLHAVGAEVWVDVEGISHGNFMQRINDALERCEWMVLVLTPNAISSEYVRDEVFTALHRTKQGYMRAVIPVLAAPCAPGTIPPMWDVLQRYDATRGYVAARDALLHALGLTIPMGPAAAQQTTSAPPTAASRQATPAQPAQQAAKPSAPAASSALLPAGLAQLGYEARRSGAVEYIVPPLCAVSAGEFLMGSDPKQDSRAYDDEQPQHRVTLPAFQIARFPVTVAEYACFVRAGQGAPSDWQAQLAKLDHPVVNVTWRDAVAYAAWLARLTGQPWRLPSEAEWEKAAHWDPAQRHARIYPWGDAFDKARCNTSESGIRATTPVGTYPSGASPCGAQDLAGNVREWTSSLFKPYPYTPTDGRERADSTEHRVLRGGSWDDNARLARAAYRYLNAPDYVYVIDGFRLALAVPGSF